MREEDGLPPGSRARVVAVGASAGGLDALSAVLGAIRYGFSLPIVMVQHLSPGHVSHLAGLLSKRTPLPVSEAADGQSLVGGRVYVAPPGRHLSVRGDVLRLTDEPAVRFSRPSVDVLFESVARSFGSAAIGVVLSGSGTDGTAGARAIRAAGGRVLAQNEASSINHGMPGAVIAAGEADAELAPAQIAAYLEKESHGV